MLGAVGQPGVFDQGPALDALTAVGLAGGATAEANLRAVRIESRAGRSRVDLSQGTVPLPMGATVHVPRRDPTDRHTAAINVTGATRSPGRVPVAGPMALADVIAMAGGPTNKAAVDGARLIRRGPRHRLMPDRREVISAWNGVIWPSP